MKTDTALRHWILGLLTPAAVLLALAGPAPAQLEPGEFDSGPFDAMLKTYVTEGWVDYAAWKANDLAALDAYLADAGQYDLTSTMGKEPRAAFLINVHNAWAVRQILEHYPVDSVTEIPGFFRENTTTVAGEELSLVGIEDKLASMIPRQPTFAFALARGTVGGPRLHDHVATGATLIKDLWEAASDFATKAHTVYYDAGPNELHVPPQLLAHVELYFAFENGMGEVLADYINLDELVAINYNKPTLVVDPQDMSLNDVSRRPAKP